MEQLLKKIAKKNVLIIGDAMLDHYIWGDVKRISPEAPVPVVRIHKETYVPGGAANVALNIKSIGGACSLSSWIGIDEAAERLTYILDKARINQEYLFQKESINTILKSRVVARQQQVCRMDKEDKPSCYKLESNTILELLRPNIDNFDAIILSDYAKGVMHSDLVEDIVKLAHESDCIVAMDPKPASSINFSNIDLLTPNQSESYELAKITPHPDIEYPAEEICKAIWDRFTPKYLVITLGAAGMLISQEGKIVHKIPTYAQEVFDVSGAGDTVISTLTLALAAGAEVQEAAHLANIAAGIVVSKIGTATVKPAEILEFELAHTHE